ncbi:MAG TPA: GAF domain-containing protein [Chloroflexia bacterium]|nr:GAF domain-containing protein [Chloroflexia bacterium]
MARILKSNRMASMSGAAFTLDEFVGRKPSAPTDRVLPVVTRINDLLIEAGNQRALFNAIAQAYAQAFTYPIVAIVLFDDDLQEVQVAGINDEQIALLEKRRGTGILYKRAYPISTVQDLDWLKAVFNGLIYVTGNPVNLCTPFVTPRRMETLMQKLNILQGVTVPLSIEDRLVGALKVGSTRTEYERGEREDLVALAHHLTIAIEIWRLYDRAEGRTAVLKRLHNLSQTITGILDLDSLVNEVAKAAGKLARIDFCSVHTFTRDLKGYNNRAVWRKDESLPLATETYSLDIFPPAIVRRALQGEPILVPDLGLYPAAQARLERWRIKSVALFAFRSEGRPVGFVVVGREQPGEWDRNTVEVLEELAEYMSVAFYNAHRYTKAARQAETQTALAENARLIAHADTDSVLQTVVQAGSRLLMDSQCALLLANQSGDLVCAAIAGPYTEGIVGYAVKGGEGLLGKAQVEQQPILVDDIQTANDSTYRPVAGLTGLHSFVAIPMLTQRGCIGVLSATHREIGIYDQTHCELLKTLADHATIALEKSRLLQEAKTQAAEQAALAESAGAIARLDVYAVLQTIVTRASEIVRNANGAVFLHDEKANELYWAAGYNSESDMQTLRLRPDAGLIGHVFVTGEAILVGDLEQDERPIAQYINERENLHSLLAVPLKGSSGNVGVLALVHTEANIFTLHDLDLLNTFADHATIALSNARLYANLRQREEERTRLLHQLLTSQDAERRRVAVDIHDGPLQTIAVNILAVDRVRRLVEMGRTEDARNELAQIHEGMAGVVQELRDMINDMRPAILESLGLVIAATAYLNDFMKHTGIVVHMEDERNGKRVPPTVEATFYRLLQEALTNVRKHADANSVWVKFSISGGQFRMDITDNGRGFDAAYAVARSLERGHIGLHSMQERIEVAGGGMEIESASGKGSRITFWIPVAT